MKSTPCRSKLWKFASTVIASMMILALLPMSPAAAATTNVVAGASYSYTEQQGVIGIGSGITITDGTSYDGEYIDFEVNAADAHDVLSLDTVGASSTAAGVVSIVGNSVYLGNGSIAEPVGSVDSTYDGHNGRKLRVNFTTAFANPGFEDGGTLGWTPLQQRIDLGTTSIAGFVANDTSTYPGKAPNRDNNAPRPSASYSVGSVTTGQPTEGTYALQLQSSMTTAQGCDVVHGPAVYSSEFQAAAGDKIYFDWRAFSGGDAYAVFGYIVDRNGNQTEVLDAYANDSSNTNWATKETVIPAGGHYRFVFVAGTFDATCGMAAGASLLIDNVKVFGSKASDDVAQQVARKLRYANTSDNPAAQRTVTVTAKSKTNGTDSDTLTVNITAVDDPFDASNPADIVFTNNAATGETFSATGGQIAVVDPDTTSFDFALAGSTATSTTVGAYTYDQAVNSDYGTMYLDSATGRYAFAPTGAAIDSRLIDDLEQFPVTVTSGAFSDQVTLTMRVDVPEGVPGAPTNLQATPGNGTVQLAWDAPSWIGGIGISGYRVYVSDNGGTTWDPLTPDNGSGDTTKVLTGLNNGTAYRFRVVALNSSGESLASSTVTSTPRTVPGAPTLTALVEGDGSLTVTFAAPASNGGAAITGYKVTSDGGATWVSAGTAPGTVTVNELSNGTSYSVAVIAENAAGTGAQSTPLSGTPRKTPDAPGISEILEHDQSIDIRIAAPSFDGGSPVTGYEVSLDGGATFDHSFGAGTEWASIAGLSNGTSYVVSVRAINEAGAGAASETVATTPRTVPGAPAITAISEGDGILQVTFAAPASDGGDAVTGYEISTDGGTTWVSAGNGPGTVTVEPLANGTTYQVIVRARNEAGPGASSTPESATPRTVAGTPVVNSVIEGDRTLTVQFDAPSMDGGAAITGYEASLDGGTTWQSIAGPTSVVFSELTNGETYQVSIRAINEAGSSTASAVVPGTPRTVATAPTITRITSGNRSLTVHLQAPSFDGGSPVTRYEVSIDNGVTWTRSFSADQSPLRLFGLDNGTTYPVKVRALNEAGAGSASTAVPGTPVKEPITVGGPDGSGGSTSGPGGDGNESGTVKVAPGKSVVVINGEDTTIDTASEPGAGSVELSGEGWTATIGGVDDDGHSMTIDAQGRLVVIEGGSIRVTGSGFAPGSTVDVWLFSTPTFLGDVLVGADGSFDQLLALPEGIELGEHTVQMNGLGTSGEVYSISTGLILDPAPRKSAPMASSPRATRLAFTGAFSLLVAPWGLVALVGGIGLVFVGRREQDESEVAPKAD